MAILSGILTCVLITLQCTTSENAQQIFINNQNLPRLHENSLNRIHITSNTTIFFVFVQSSLQSNIVFRDVANLSLQFVFTNLYCTDRNGFVFINITGLEIMGMTLTNCGMKISQSLIQEALTIQTNSNYLLLEGLKAAIFAVNVRNLLIEFSNVSRSHGYGFLGINVLGNSTFHYVDIIGSNALTALNVRCTQQDISFSEIAECQGGNALFLFDDLPHCPPSLSSYTLTLNQTSITDGVNPLVPYSIVHAEFSTAGGLTVIEGQSNYVLKLNIISSVFIRNRGNRGGNILIQLPNTVSSSSITIQNCLSFYAIANFPVYITVGSLDLIDARRNLPECGTLRDRANNMGRRLEVLTIENSNFTLNVGGGISILVVRSYLPLYLTSTQPVFVVSIINCTVRGNIALGPITGAASGLAVAEIAYGERQSTEVNVVGTLFEKNLHVKPSGNSLHSYIATNRFQSIGKATFRNCTFNGNNYSAILADNSFVFFEGTNSFINNTSPYGGAFFLTSSARILLKPNVQLIFINNFASEKGGAIFVDVSDLTSISHCNVEVFDPDYLQLSELNITMEFINNSAAKTGDVYYGGLLDYCFIQSPSVFMRTTSKGNYTFSFVSDFSGQNSSRSLVSSEGTKICLCDNKHVQNICTNLSRQTSFVSYYPGELFEIFVVIRDQSNNPVPSVVTTTHTVAGKYDFNELTDTSSCNLLTYRLQNTWQGFELFYIVPSNLLIFESVSALILLVNFLNCSSLTGFTLDNDTKVCSCVPQLQERNMTCNIDTKNITRQPPYWLSNYSNHLLLHDNCPYDYCKPDQVQIVMTEPSISEQCAFNRYGTLCGSCKEGFSQVLGSSRCLKCSNSYLSLLIPFGLAGIALIGLLFIFNLTTYSGKINGLIYYASVIHINMQVFFSPGEQDFFKTFISWINLDLGIETCFYDGMGPHTKLWLQLIFPVYLIVLMAIAAIIYHLLTLLRKKQKKFEFYFRILGKFGRRIIPVLATIILLSYTKLLQVIFTVLSFTHLDYPDGSRVIWLYNGNITFGKGTHLSLLIVSLILLVIVVLPYIVLLVLFPLIINIAYFKSNKVVRYMKELNILKDFVDTYLNPYKYHPHCGVYWPALLLITRTFHVIVFASTLGDPGVNLFVIIANTFLFVILNLAVGGVYKSRLLTVLETSYLLNIGILGAATAVSDLFGVHQAIVVYLSIVIAIITFASVYIYQGLIVCAIKYRHNSWCSKLLKLIGRGSANIPNSEHDLRGPPNSGSREQPKPCITTTTIKGIPEEEENDVTEQQAEVAL